MSIKCHLNILVFVGRTLKGNGLHGLFPGTTVWKGLPDLVVVDMSNNELNGEIECSISYCEHLQALLVGGNMLTGELPFCLTSISQTLGVMYVPYSMNMQTQHSYFDHG
jgi:hypothetical protein